MPCVLAAASDRQRDLWVRKGSKTHELPPADEDGDHQQQTQDQRAVIGTPFCAGFLRSPAIRAKRRTGRDRLLAEIAVLGGDHGGANVAGHGLFRRSLERASTCGSHGLETAATMSNRMNA